MWRDSIRTEIKELLGEGTQGRVFKALRVDRQTGLSQTVAIKILHSETAVELWQKEFQSLARVRSPYCVQVLSFERITGRPALILEYVEGLSLAELARAAILTDAEIGEVLAQIEVGLKDLERHGSCHGDLSPANVMIDQLGHVRLLDFGLANGRRATPEFSAPERLASAPADFRSDLFSLGRIEEFLRRERLETPLLALDPAKRATRDLPPNSVCQNSLALKIQTLLDHRRATTCLTAALGETHSPPVRRSGRFEKIVALTAVCAFLGSSEATIPRYNPSMGQINVGTENWYELSLNGVVLGFTPLHLTLKSGRHVLTYRSATSSGKLQVDVRAGETLRLSDREFEKFSVKSPH